MSVSFAGSLIATSEYFFVCFIYFYDFFNVCVRGCLLAGYFTLYVEFLSSLNEWMNEWMLWCKCVCVVQCLILLRSSLKWQSPCDLKTFASWWLRFSLHERKKPRALCVLPISNHESVVNRLNEKIAQKDANTARAGCSKVRTPPARPLSQTHKPTDRTDYNTLRRS